MKFLLLILRNLRQSLRRTILTTLSISISVFIFAASISLPATINEILRDRVSTVRLLCHSKGGFEYPLPAAYLRTIEGINHIAAVTGYVVFNGTYRDPGVSLPAVAVDADQFPRVLSEWVDASAAAGLQRSRSACLVSRSLMKRYKWKRGDKIILHGLDGNLELAIEGVLSSEITYDVVVCRRECLDQFPRLSDKVALYWIKVDRSDSIPAVIEAIDSQFANSSFQTSTESETAVALWQIRGYRLMITLAEFFALIVVLMIGLVAANTAAMVLRERRRDIAMMRAIGYPRRVVVGLLIAEGTLICLAAGAIGCVLAWALLDLLPMLVGDAAPVTGLTLLPRVVLESVGIAMMVGFSSAAIPALTATRRDLISELRAI
ncbi:MAG: ABC transporter permease [Candidatus Binataceae bacterium]